MLTRLHLNENVFTHDSPVIEDVINNINSIYLYPDMKYCSLKSKLADWLGVNPDQVVIGNGSSELIQRMYMDKLCGKGKVIFPWPSYILYSELEDLSSIPACKVPLRNDLKIDLKTILKHVDQETKLVILCNPNNPTGTIFKRSELEDFLKYVPKHVNVLVDEAYIDYVDDVDNYSALGLINKWSNLIVVKTFSKLYGLAALRLGYAVSTKETALWLQSKLPNWNINRIAEIALESCLNNLEYFDRIRENVKIEREWLSEQINNLGFNSIASSANFIYVFNSGIKGIKNFLEESGILVKSMTELEWEAIRITVGRRSDNEMLVEKLKNFRRNSQ